MTFVFPFILGGLVLIGVPVLIHLIMRQKPKTLKFPAFRFLMQRHKKNQRKIRLRHLLLLALRIFLIVAICLAVARPKIFNEALKVGGDRPVAAIFLFDTSYSMEYKVGDEARLEDAKKRGRELLNDLPEGSRVAILDTADLAETGKGEWLTSLHQARERIERLKLRHANAPVTTRLETAYRLFADLARSRDDDTARQLTRLLCVFSDRTRGGWDIERLGKLHDLRDQVPPPFERLSFVRDSIAGLIDLLGDLRTRIPPPPGQDYPEKSVIDLLGQLREKISNLNADDYPDAGFSTFVAQVRSRSRELLDKVQKHEQVPEGAKEYRDKLVGALQTLSGNLRGVHEIYVDVGVDNPVDLAITELELPRQLNNEPRQIFAPGEPITLRAVLQATGDDFENHLIWRIGATKEKQLVRVKKGESTTVRFTMNTKDAPLTPGTHQIKVELEAKDQLAFNNSRFVTFAIRDRRKVLVIADEPTKTSDWRRALESTFAFDAVVQTPKQVLEQPHLLKDSYHAVHLLRVAKPDRDLWTLLKDYVQRGGGLAVMPPGDELTVGANLTAYQSEIAEQLLPAKISRHVKAEKKAGQWNWDKMLMQHPFMAPFKMWENSDLKGDPRTAKRYWLVQPQADATVLVTYTDEGDPPALIERTLPQGTRRGRVLLFTTPIHHVSDDQVTQQWNDYLRLGHSFFPVMAHLTTSYLAGDAEAVRLNFITGQEVPVADVRLGKGAPSYLLQRDGAQVETLTVDPAQTELRVHQAEAPGNYALVGPDNQRVAGFSVNMPADECVLKRVSVADVESLFGPGSVVPVDFQTNLRDALQGHWSQPIELLPFLLVLLLLVLAVENLLANKFYRREPETPS